MLNRLLIALSLSIFAASCGGIGVEDPIVTENVAEETSEESKADRADIPVQGIADFRIPSEVGTTVTRKLFTSASAFRAYFRAEPPVSMTTNWIVFYSAGTQRTGGYAASVQRVRLSDDGYVIKVTTRLDSPGSNCMVTQSLTKPYALAYFPKPRPVPYYVSYYRSDTTRDCSQLTCQTARCAPGYFCTEIDGVHCVPYATCANSEACPAGTHCVDQPIVCVRAPCAPTAPACVADCAGPSSVSPAPADVAGSFHNDDRNDSASPAIYPRNFSFAADGTFSVSDAVSPCPPGATCIWSGYVYGSGTWRVDGSLVRLAIAGGQAGFGIAYPAELAVEKTCDGALQLVEHRADGTNRVYGR